MDGFIDWPSKLVDLAWNMLMMGIGYYLRHRHGPKW